MILECRILRHNDILDGVYRGDIGVFKKKAGADIAITEGNFFDGYLIAGNCNVMYEGQKYPAFNEDEYFKAYYIEDKDSVIEFVVDNIDHYEVGKEIDLSIDNNYGCIFVVLSLLGNYDNSGVVKLREYTIQNKDNKCSCGKTSESHHVYCWKCGNKIKRRKNRFIDRREN